MILVNASLYYIYRDRLNIRLKQADDHDMVWTSTLVPFSILNLHTDKLSIYFGNSAETSDFIVDCLVRWWSEHKEDYHAISKNY
jgi:Rhodopirellula transposase DDE domain